MTDREWTAVVLLLDKGWPQDFGEAEEGAYRAVLRRFDPQVVAQAVGDLAAAGAKFRPSVGEVAAACNAIVGNMAPGDFDAPSWLEVYPVAERAAYRFMRASAKATQYVRDQLGDVAAAWFANGGREQILGAKLGEDQYAHRNRQDIGKAYDAFVETQRQRAARGLTVTTVESHGGLHAATDLRTLNRGDA